MITSFQDFHPDIAQDVYIDPQATVIGQVTLAEHVSLWPGAILRGDVHSIQVGAYTNIQDHVVGHVSHASQYNATGAPLSIGAYVTVGHRATLHGCEIQDRVLCGIGAIILDGAVIESDCIIAAGSLVPPHKHLPAGYLYLGNPVKAQRRLTAAEIESITYNAMHYAKLKQEYLKFTQS